MGAVRELIAKFESQVENKGLAKTETLLDKLAKKSGTVGASLKDLFRKAEAEKQAAKAKAAFDALDDAGRKTLENAVKAEDAQKKAAEGATAALTKVRNVYLLVGAAVVGFVQNVVAQAEQLHYTSQQLRVTTQEMQLMGAMGRSVGLDMNAMAGIMGTLRGKVDEAARGLGDGGYTFRRLGVQIRDTSGAVRPLPQIFRDTMIAIAGVTRESRRLALTDRMLGTEGRRFISQFTQGRDALAEFAQIMADSGGGMSQKAIDDALELSRAWNVAGLSGDSLKGQIMEVLLPALTKLVRFGTKVLNFFNRTTLAANTLKIAAVALGTYGARAAVMWALANLPLIGQFLLIAAAVGIVVLIVDDLINLFSGGESVIGGFIDELFGVGTAADVVHSLQESFEGVLAVVRFVRDTLKEVWDLIHIGYDAQNDPANQATSTRVSAGARASMERNPALYQQRQRGQRANAPGLPARAPGRPTTAVVPARIVAAPAGLRGGSVMVPAPGASGMRRPAPNENLNEGQQVHVHINNPTGNGQEIARQAAPAIQRTVQANNRRTVQNLQDAGLIHNTTPETHEG